MASAALLSNGGGAAAETPQQIAQALSAGHPEVAAMLKAHPEALRIWAREPDWAAVMLRAPRLSGTPWRVNDLRRPQPRPVRPAMQDCATAAAPADAVALLTAAGPVGFEGPGLAAWPVTPEAMISPATDFLRIRSKAAFGDVQVHLEFREPAPPRGDWQYRGNSGVFLMGRYEIQILDGFDNPTYADGSMGALYGQQPPLVNASLPPGHWQCLDISFTAPRFRGARLVSPARVTVLHNGVVVQANAAFRGPTRHASALPYVAHADRLPLELQDHGDGTSRVSFRNIWARDIRR